MSTISMNRMGDWGHWRQEISHSPILFRNTTHISSCISAYVVVWRFSRCKGLRKHLHIRFAMFKRKSSFLVVKNKGLSPRYLFHFHHLGILKGYSLHWDVGYEKHSGVYSDGRKQSVGSLFQGPLKNTATNIQDCDYILVCLFYPQNCLSLTGYFSLNSATILSFHNIILQSLDRSYN